VTIRCRFAAHNLAPYGSQSNGSDEAKGRRLAGSPPGPAVKIPHCCHWGDPIAGDAGGDGGRDACLCLSSVGVALIWRNCTFWIRSNLFCEISLELLEKAVFPFASPDGLAYRWFGITDRLRSFHDCLFLQRP
jgi:hypothetical protein